MSSKSSTWSVWDYTNISSSGGANLNMQKMIESPNGTKKLERLAEILELDEKYKHIEIEVRPAQGR